MLDNDVYATYPAWQGYPIAYAENSKQKINSLLPGHLTEPSHQRTCLLSSS